MSYLDLLDKEKKKQLKIELEASAIAKQNNEKYRDSYMELLYEEQRKQKEIEEEAKAKQKENKAKYDNIAPVLGVDSSNDGLAYLSFAKQRAEGKEKEVAKSILETDKRDANFWDLTWNSITRGYNNARFGEESFAAMSGQKNEKEAYQKLLSSDKYQFTPDNWFEEAVSGAFEQIGQQARQLTHPRTLGMAGGAAGAAALAGQAGPQIAIPEEVVTVPAAAIAGFTAGSVASNLEIEAGLAYNEMLEAGINEKTARNIALGVGTVNAGLELLQVDELVDAYKIVSKTGVTDNFAKKIFKELVDRGVDVAKETAQEVAQEGVTIAGVQAASKIDKGEWAYSGEEVGNRLWDTAKSSALTFGMLNTPATAKNIVSISKDQGSATSYTQNEQAVIEKETENRIAEAEKGGEKLSAKEKSEIEAQVEKDLESGYISTDTIENVLGGESKSAYDSLLQESEEFNTLYETEGSKLSEKQKDRLAELKQKNTETPYESALQTAREKVTQTAFEAAKGDRLAESFYEKERKKQAFTADVNQYKSESARQTVQNVIDSGIANNTKKFHSFVDLLAKISDEKGLVFHVTNNQKLQGTKYMVDGKAPNGFIEGNQVTINLSSQKTIDYIAGHEIAHSLEKSGMYKELQKAVEQYARTKGEYDSRLASLTERYKGKGDPARELVADMVGEYVFTDADFVRNLSVNHRNVFQKIFDEIKYLWKVATAGSKEARELERVKKLFEEAYREGGAQKNTADSGAKYDIVALENGNVYVTASRNVIKSKTKAEQRKEISNFFSTLLDGKNSLDIQTVEGDVLTITKKETAKKARDDFKTVDGQQIPMTDDEFTVKMHVESHIDEVAEVSTPMKGGKKDTKNHSFAKDGFTYRRAYFEDFDGQYYEVTLSIGNNGTIATVYNVGKIEGSVPPSAKVIAVVGSKPLGETLSLNDIPQESDSVKPEFSLSDTDGRQLSQEQQDFFKESVVRDESGNLKVMYHGTSRGGHTMFDPYGKAKYGLFGLGSYFTDNKTVAESYTKKGKGNAPQVYETYLNIKNPMDMDAAADPAAWAEAFPEAHFPESGTNEQFYRAMEEYFEDNEYVRWEAEEAAMDAIMGMGYDGITHIGGGRFNKSDDTRHRVYIAFQPEQIKDVGNTKPTDHPDIRYSLSEDTEGNKLTEEQEAYFSESKMRDENGNLVPMYHGTKDGGFHVFDRRYSDDHTSFFFVDSNDVASSYSGTSETYAAQSFKTAEDLNQFFNEIGKLWYEVVEENGKFVLLENGDFIAESDTALGAYEEFCDWDGVGYGDVNYKVYLNLKNPLEVDADGKEWNELRNWSKAAFVKEADVEVRRVGDEFRLFDKNNKEIDGASIVVNQYNENMDSNILRSIMVGKVNNRLSILTENLTTTRDVSNWARKNGYDGVIFRNILDVGGYGGKYDPHTVAIAFDSNQIKSVANKMPTTGDDIRYSKQGGGKTGGRGEFSIPAREFLREQQAEVAPVEQTVAEAPVKEVAPVKTEPEVQYSTEEELFPDSSVTMEDLQDEQEGLLTALEAAANRGDYETMSRLTADYEAVTKQIREMQSNEDSRISSLAETEAPPEMDAPYPGDPGVGRVESPLADRDEVEVGKRNIKAYMYENPEVKPYFQDAARIMLGDLGESIRGEKFYDPDLHYSSGGEKGWYGVKRHTTADIAELLDQWGYSYAEIEKGLNAIIEDNGKENNACSKRIEFMLDERLRNGYTDVWGEPMPADQGYINLLREKQINEYSREAFDNLFANADMYAPVAQEEPVPAGDAAQDIAPTLPLPYDLKGVNKGQERVYEFTPQKTIDQQGTAPVNPGVTPAAEAVTSKSGEVKGQQALTKDAIRNQSEARATIMTEEPKAESKEVSGRQMFRELVLDNGMVFEKLSQKTKNRELQGKWNFMRYSTGRAQRLIGNGAEGVKSLNSIREQVEKSGQTQAFYEYLYHKHNMDRMTLEDRYKDTPNKAVFGDTVTAEVSKGIVRRLERSNPEFASWANDVYSYNEHLRKLLVDSGVISQETADLWKEMYPHYVPIRRLGDTGLNINVPLDTGRTGVNAPIKRATGGSRDILPLFDTMAQRTLQTYRAIAKNNFGVELKNTLGTTVAKDKATLDGVLENIDNQEELLKEGKNGKNPTFTVFENGERVEFEITEEMYQALKPVSKALSYTNKILNKASNLHRGLLTEYNPVFLINNAIKDIQDVVINSQHPAKTYARVPQAYLELTKKGKWYQEYIENGGEQNTYFDDETNTFAKEHRGLMKMLDGISNANNFIERAPRLAEYIASREAGRSIEVSMLDAARVTTNFAAGGKLTKFANRNGATFLNASVQGIVQQARNIQEAKMNGLKGWLSLAARYTAAGLPAVLLNALMWEDDEEYEELSDYVKQNYYVVAKYGDGKFVRIPKGRTVAVIQNAIEQVSNMSSGDAEADWGEFFKLALSNLAPNNPFTDNILAPVIQAWNNKTWYGEDLVPTRLQDLPAAEQYDESTDSISKWLGEAAASVGLDISPVKINYVLDQYSGGIGDTILPMLTPEAESGADSFGDYMLAPFKSKFTTDSTMNNQNVSDFYDTVDQLTTAAKSSTATDEDALKYKYMNSVNAQLGKLYAEKRKIQNSDMPNARKYEQVRQIQQQIVDLAKSALETYGNVSTSGDAAAIGDMRFEKTDNGWEKLSAEEAKKMEITSAAGDAMYATDGDVHYRWYEPGEDSTAEAGWRKLSDKELERQEEITKGLGITPEEYWSKQEEYSYAYEHPENYAVAKSVGGYEAYKNYSSELYDIKADKDENGKSISGSRKDKVIDYVNGLDIDYGMKLILFKSEYNADDTYNTEIIQYLDSREDISWQDMKTILTKLGFTVYDNGRIEWS